MHFAIGDFVLDLIQNSVEAGSSLIEVDIDEAMNGVYVCIFDNGCGMSPDEIDRAFDPLKNSAVKHPGRKAGFGLPFIKQAVEQAYGSFKISSEKGKGTKVYFSFPKSSIDSPPLGDVSELFLNALNMVGASELILRRKRSSDGLSYEVKKSELVEAVGDLTSASSLSLVKQYLASQEE